MPKILIEGRTWVWTPDYAMIDGLRLRYASLSTGVAGIPGSGTRLAIAAGAEHTVYLGMFLGFIITSALVNYQSLNFHPDAYYYFGIARNLADGGTFTFDGESVTTGFHPLWQFLSTGIYFVFRDMASFHVAILGTSTLLFIGGYLLLAQVALRNGISPGAFGLVSIPVFAINVSLFQKSGMENSLVFFLLSLFLWTQYQGWRDSGRTVVATALVLSLVYLARLDSIFLIPLFVGWYTVSRWRAGRLLPALALPAIVGAVILTHWLIMLVSFDTISPTSQLAIKGHLAASSSSNIVEAFSPDQHPLVTRAQELLSMGGIHLDPGQRSPDRYLGLLVPLSLLVGLFLVVRRNFWARLPIAMIGLMSVLQLVYYAVFLNGWMGYWYFTGSHIVILFGLAFLVSGLMRRPHVLATSCVVGLALLALLMVNAGRGNVHWSTQEERSKLLQDYDNGENVLVGFTPDRASFLSGVPIRHLEGLVNGYDYIRSYLIPGRVASYMEDIGATHFVVSNRPNLPEYVPCQVEIAADNDGGLSAYGTYDRHNGYIAVYDVSFSSGESAGRLPMTDETCRPGVRAVSISQ